MRYVPNTDLHLLIYLILTKTQWSKYCYYPYFFRWIQSSGSLNNFAHAHNPYAILLLPLNETS